MTDIPEHIVERVARAIVSCWLDSEAEIDAEWTEYEEEARAAIEALGGETVRGLINGYSYGTVYPDRVENTPIKSFTDRYLLIPLGEEGGQ